MRRRTVVDLFAGCGGMSLGLEMAGFDPIFVSELHPDALATYVANRPNSLVALPENQANDILEYSLNPRKLRNLAERLNSTTSGAVDLVVGGPPCQGYSGIGHRRTFVGLAKEDIPSNHLYREMAHFISAVSPKAFVFENVSGLLSARWTPEGQAGEIWKAVRAELAGIQGHANGVSVGYTVRAEVVRARNYGVPQNRPRVLCVGIRNDLEPMVNDDLLAGGFLPEGSNDWPDVVDVLGDLRDPAWTADLRMTDLYPHSADGTWPRYFRTRPDGELMRKGTPLSEQEYSHHNDRVRRRFELLQAGRSLPQELITKKFAQRPLPPRWDDRGPTITVASLPDDYVHYADPRTLTVREWARLQTFPDWYEFKGKRTTGGRRRAGDPSVGDWSREVPKYTQIGNAVPVLLAKSVGLHLGRVLTSLGV